jgi:hypothetical protein
LATLITTLGVVAVALINDDDPPSSDKVDASTTPTPSPAPPSPTPTSDYVSSWKVSDGTLTVTASVESYKAPGAGATFLMPQGGVAPESWPNQLADPEGYARQHGGVPAGSSSVLLTLRTTSQEPLVISSVKPVVVETRGTAAGDYAVKIPYGCGGMPLRVVSGNFDASPAKLTYDPGTGQAPMPASRMSLSVSASDPEVVNVQAVARSKTKAWQAVISYVDPKSGQVNHLEVDQNGEPFLVTQATEGSAVYVWAEQQGMQEDPTGDPYGFC